MVAELSGAGECINRHAGSLEAHHESFYNAQNTFKDLYQRSTKLGESSKFEIAKLYAAVAPIESYAIHIQNLNEQVKKSEQETEKIRNTALNNESATNQRFEDTANDIRQTVKRSRAWTPWMRS